MNRESGLAVPVAKRVEVVREIHGYVERDEYAWLADREKSDPEVLGYLRAEDEYAQGVMKPTEELRESLYREMLGRIRETDENVPYRRGDYYYYTRTEEGRQYPICCRKKGVDGEEEVTLDLNLMAEGKPFFSLGAYEVSDDGARLALATDETGFRQYSLRVKDLRTGEMTESLAERITGVVWCRDNRTLCYTQEDETTKRSDRLWRLVVGEGEAERLWEEKDELYRLEVERTRSGDYIIVTSSSFTTTEVRYLRADEPAGVLRLLLARSGEHEYFVDHAREGSRDWFFIRTNDHGRNFRLVKTLVSDFSAERWPACGEEVIPHRAEVMLEGIDVFAGHFVALERENGLTRMVVHDLAGGGSHPIAFPEPVYVAAPESNHEFESTRYRFRYESLVTPRSVFDYEIAAREMVLLKQQPVLGGYDARQYRSERIWATAADGTKVPISIVCRRDLQCDGSHPLLLDGYGSYGIPNDVDFSSNRVSLLDRGVIFAIAHIRGGGDLGKKWHDSGKLMVKKNTFTDFIACAEHLIAGGYTSRERLVITGGSAGGLLMGAVVNMRPDLFRAVLSYVPFVDVMNTMLDPTLPLTVGEYLEWGNPNEKAAYDYMRSYSPCDNIVSMDYPAMLVRTSLNDSQVMYWEPAKYVARLRATKTDDNPLLFRVKLEPGGHGGASGRYDRLRDTAFDYAFILWQTGLWQGGFSDGVLPQIS